MTNYMALAWKYLRSNLRRTLVTILGVTLTAMTLYGGFNLGYGWIMQMRDDVRQEYDYEIILITTDESMIEQILADPKVKSAYLAPYYYQEYVNGEWQSELYPNVIYANTRNPYRMKAILSELTSKYGIEGNYNEELGEWYLQGREGSFWLVMFLLALMIGFVFSIFGVGIVRNSIHLSMLENIRDYGNLRCIGGSKKQIKAVIFLQGFYMESIGVVLGSLLGTVLTYGIGVISMNHKTPASIELSISPAFLGFHILPLIIVFLEFLFDLYFIMDENVKLVIRMSPVSAIRGEYRVKLPKIKERNSNIIRRLLVKLLGVDGDYAFKNIMRSPGRFFRTVGAMAFGVAAFMALSAQLHSMRNAMTEELDRAGYYQIYINNTLDREETIDEVEMSLPSVEELAEIAGLSDISEAKRMYVATGYPESPGMVEDHYSQEFRESDYGECILAEHTASAGSVTCYGYDDADFRRLESVLTDGTVHVSSQGVVLVNEITTYDENPYATDHLNEYQYYRVPYTDYQVGDTITILDIGEMHKRLDEPLSGLQKEEYEMLCELSEDENYNKEHFLEEFDDKYCRSRTPQLARANEIVDEYTEKQQDIIASVEAQLKAEGLYRTYTIEGIVSRNVNVQFEDPEGGSLSVLMPLAGFCEATGLSENQPTGMMYHTDRLFPNVNRILEMRRESIMSFYMEETVGTEDGTTVFFPNDYGVSDKFVVRDSVSRFSADYLETVSEFAYMQQEVIVIWAVVTFFMMMFVLNLVNATEANLYARRNELAQLRVIGVSKKHLIRMVMLEGVLEAVIADVIGILLGIGLTAAVYWVLWVIFQAKFYFPVGVMVICIISSLLITCGAIYFPIQRLTNDLAGDLKISEY